MYGRTDANMLNMIFGLSGQALIRMVNHLFRTEYADDETVWKEWSEEKDSSVSLVVGGISRYEFGIRYLDGCVQLQAKARGLRSYETRPIARPVTRIRESGMAGFGENTREEYAVTLEFSGRERVRLPERNITFSERSAKKLEEDGLILFLPFLFHLFIPEPGQEEEAQEALKYFVIHDIVGTLNLSMQRGNLNVYDVQRMKQLCRQMIWRLFPGVSWMQELERQELVLSALDADMEQVERVHRLELERLRNK